MEKRCCHASDHLTWGSFGKSITHPNPDFSFVSTNVELELEEASILARPKAL